MDSFSSLYGVYVAVYTPFSPGASGIDEDALARHISSLIEAGVHGIIPGGSTGEFTSLSILERKKLLELSIKCAGSRVPVVASVGALTQQDCLELATHAASVGAAALMLVPPFYDSLSVDQLRRLLSEIHTATHLPIMYYHIPSLTGMNLTAVELASLAGSGVQYVKYTAEDACGMTEMLWQHDKSMITFSGNDTLMFYALAAGARGMVWGLANVIPEIVVQFWNMLAVQRDLKAASSLWAQIWPLCKFFESHHYAATVKTAMELMGTPTGGMRKPFSLLREEDRQELHRLLVRAGVKTACVNGKEVA